MKQNDAVFAFGHFLVDMACAMLMLGQLPGAVWFLVYNFCAFALQMPIGILADLVNHCKRFCVAGIVLILAANLPLPLPLRVILVGVGNACYHVGGGRSALLADRKFSGLGIFVAPGAVGIFLGGLLAGNRIAAICCAAALTACGIALCIDGKPEYPQFRGKARWGWLSLMVLVVLIRSCLGLCMDSPWKVGVFVGASAICAALGKALGGFAADRAGWKKAGVVSLLVSAVLYCIPGFGAAGCAAVLLFNMSMPVTLRRAAEDLPGMEGFAFGLLTFALFLGYLPAYYGLHLPPVAAAALSVVSAGLLAAYREEKA